MAEKPSRKSSGDEITDWDAPAPPGYVPTPAHQAQFTRDFSDKDGVLVLEPDHDRTMKPGEEHAMVKAEIARQQARDRAMYPRK
jgi:hypothetical protein